MRPDQDASTARLGSRLYASGLVAVLVGSVLPWLRLGDEVLWGWDFSLVWVLTGVTRSVGLPPPAAGTVVACALVLAIPVVFGRRLPGVLTAVLCAVVFGVGAMTVARSLGVAAGFPVHAGLGLALAGAAALAAGALFQAG